MCTVFVFYEFVVILLYFPSLKTFFYYKAHGIVSPLVGNHSHTPHYWKARSQPLEFQGCPHTHVIDEHTEIWPGQTAFPRSHNPWMSNWHLNGSSQDLEYPLAPALSWLVNSHQACWPQLSGVHKLIVLTCGFLEQPRWRVSVAKEIRSKS